MRRKFLAEDHPDRLVSERVLAAFQKWHRFSNNVERPAKRRQLAQKFEELHKSILRLLPTPGEQDVSMIIGLFPTPGE